MSDKPNDGGPAFPHDMGNGYANGTGMTLRDYFAAKAMQAYIRKIKANPGSVSVEEFDAYVARSSYETADAMLKAREEQP